MSEPAPPADRRVPYGESASQFVDFRFPAAPGVGPLAVMIHGGFWRAKFDLLHAGHLCRALAGSGFATASVEYRRVGEPGGGWVAEEECSGTLEDVRQAVQFARRHAARFRGDPHRTIVLGHSAGGHLALWLAGELADLSGVVALAPVASLRLAWELRLGNGAVGEFLQGSPEEVPGRYQAADPANRPSSVPRVLIHGTADEIVPIELSREYVRLRRCDPAFVKLVELPAGDHFDVIDPQSRFHETVIREVQSITPPAPAHL
jgi:acetyl esterase/lipase